MESGLLGLTPFLPLSGSYGNSVYPVSTELSLCETLLVVCYLQEDFLLARRILQSRSANFSLEELWFQYKSLNLFR